MYIQSFSKSELSSLVRQSDLRKFHASLPKATLTAVIDDAAECASDAFKNGCSLACFRIGARQVCKITSFAHELVLRKLARNLIHVVQPEPSTRKGLIASLSKLLQEGVPFRCYRLDVRRFFDSFDPAEVIARVEGLHLLSQRSKLLYRSVMSAYQAAGGKGIPTGLEISSASAELMMLHFDTRVRMADEVFFYGRFVDDMVIITRGDEEPTAFLASLNSSLPGGVELSQDPKKRKVISFQRAGAGPARTAHFEYLGYSFEVVDPKEEKIGYSRDPRKVTVDFSGKTRNRTKTRIVRAFLSFAKDGDFDLLEKRIAYLTSNCRMNDSKTNVPKLVGVYHNHPHLSFHETCGLVKLDTFLGTIVRHPVRASSSPVVVLSPQQKARLLRHSFARGFRKRRYHHFTRAELSEIARCWKYAK